MKRISRIVGIVLVAISLLAGCDRKAPVTTGDKQQGPQNRPALQPALPTGAPEEIVRRTVERYNQLLIEGYKNLDMTQLQEAATEEVSYKAYYHMAAIAEGFARMTPALKKIEFVKTGFPDARKGTVRTREVWDYLYSDIKSGKSLQDVRDYVYHVEYTLENREGRWIITAIEATADEDPKKSPPLDKIFGKDGPGPGAR